MRLDIAIIKAELKFRRARLAAQGIVTRHEMRSWAIPGWTWKLSGWIGPDGRFVKR